MEEIYLSENIEPILKKLDYSRLGNNVAIKLHFGEEGCETYLDPKIAKAVYDAVKAKGKNAALIETNVLYRGSRTNTADHIKTAKKHGFDFAPIDIIDGERGEKYLEIKLDNGIIDSARIGKGLRKYDSMIVLTHFKGHAFASYGGALKNKGMGLGSRAGKLHMHASVSPTINKEKCTACGICIENCDVKAISYVDHEGSKKAEIDKNKCIGCAMCIAVCSVQAPEIPWMSNKRGDLQKKIVDYADAVTKIISAENTIYINVLQNITSECDCMNIKQKPMMKDIRFTLGHDIVAIDQACLDLANKHSDGKFGKTNGADDNIQISYAESKGLGSRKYKLIEI